MASDGAAPSIGTATRRYNDRLRQQSRHPDAIRLRVPLDDLAPQAFSRFFREHQHASGGFPETFPGTPPGCWTSAEIYASIQIFGLSGLVPEGGMERLESWLVEQCRSAGGRGLAHYPVGRDGALVVEASAALAVGLRVAHGDHPLADGIEDWIASVQDASGGWGVGEGETPRTYSTAYAIDALGGSRHAAVAERGRAWLRRTRRPDGTWPFRPEVEAPAWLPSRLAAWALGMGPASEGAGPLADHLLVMGERDAAVEEDEFPARDGRKLSLAYADRLVCIAGALELVARGDRARRARALRALARYEVDGPRAWIGGERTWHFLDFAWGYGGIRRQFAAGGLAEPYAEVLEAERRLRVVETFARRAPAPLATAARRAFDAADGPSEAMGAHVALVEAAGRWVRARNLADLDPAALDAVLRKEAARGPSGAGRNLRTKGPVRIDGGLLARWVDRRNDAAHRPPGTLSARAAFVLRWEAVTLEVLRALEPAVAEPALCTVEQVALPAGDGGYRYRVRRWRGDGPEDEIVRTRVRIADRLESPEAWTAWLDEGAGPERMRPLSPLVVRATCPACRVGHFYVLDGVRDEGGIVLDLVAAECGGRLTVRWGKG